MNRIVVSGIGIAMLIAGVAVAGTLPVTDNLVVHLKASMIDTSDTANEVRIDGSDVYVKNWEDQSASNNDAGQETSSDQPLYVTSGIGGAPALEFGGISDHMDFSGAILPTDGDFSAFFVFSPTNEAARGVLFSQYAGGQAGRMAFIANEDSDGTAAGYFNPWIDGATGGGGGHGGLVDDFLYTQPSIFEMTADGGTANGSRTYQNGTQQDDFTLSAVYNGTAFIGELGGGTRYHGLIAEIIVYDGALSDDDRNAVGLYLAEEYAISSSYFTYVSDLSVTNNLVTHLDASGIDTNDTVNEVRIVGSDVYVKNWEDQSVSNNDASQAISTFMPLYVASGIGGAPALDFGGVSDRMDFSGAILPTDGDFSAFIVFSPISEAVRGCMLSQYAGGENGRLAWESNSGENGMEAGKFYPFINGITDGGGPSGSSADFDYTQPSIFEMTADGGTVNGSKTYQNGTQQDDFTLSAVYNGTAIIGGQSSSDYYHGLMAEIIVYDGALGDEDRNAVGYYLAGKYGITTSYDGPLQGTIIIIN